VQCRLAGDETSIYTIMTLSPNSKACNGNMPVLQASGSSRCRHQHGKIMRTVSWDAEGVLLIDFMPRNETFAGFYYTDLLYFIKWLSQLSPRKVDPITQPSYLHNLITVQPARSTRASSLVTLARPSTSSFLRITDRSFQYASPRLWSQLPASVRQPCTNLSNSDSPSS